MALDLFHTSLLHHTDIDTGVIYYDTASNPTHRSIWLDEVGLCTFLLPTGEGETSNRYGIVQLDGTSAVRNAALQMGVTDDFQIGSDITQSGVAVVAARVPRYDLPVFQYDYDICVFDARTGGLRYANGNAVKYNRTTFSDVYVSGTTLHAQGFLGVLPDRFLFYGQDDEVGYPGVADVCLLSFPRSLSVPQVFTKEAILLHAHTYYPAPEPHSGTLSAADERDVCWISIAGGASLRTTYLLKYDYVQRQVASVATAPRLGGTTDYNIDRVWWSKRFKVFIGMSALSVNLYSQQIVPYAISAPVLISGSMQIGKGSTLRVRVTGDALSSPYSTVGDEPSAGVPVTWVCAAGGSFGPDPSITDANGYASTLYYPAPGTEGLQSITATSTFP